MDSPLPPSSQGMSTAMPIIGLAETNCNECRRRKGRCDRVLPECGPCARNKRHCLYERHSRTPLTRKYLTEVEERLRQTEARRRILEARVKDLEARGEKTRAERRVVDGQGPGDWVRVPPSTTLSVEALEGESMAHRFETAPGQADDLDWDEQAEFERPASSQVSPRETEGEAGLLDGMASLSVDDRGKGYLGMASGSAMLRLLMPHDEPRATPHGHRTTPVAGRMSDIDPGWIPTPVYYERKIAEIDLDVAIDSYFSLFHVSHPLVHEPTFRAQYAQVIPRANGRCWNALAYIIAAIGLLTTSTDDGTCRDGDLFEAARSNIALSSLESGNITLVQVLTLMSNYLQKKDKPNSGYNYLGLALHMAMGLGLHKEFQNWSTSPLNMEMRRRVWWSLFNLFSGAMITFGRPVSWPSSGIEVALPLNIDDRDLTHASSTIPTTRSGFTTHWAVAVQARFHLATNDVYARLVSAPLPKSSELIRLDDERIETWKLLWMDDVEQIPPRYQISRKILEWRYRHFRTIMYRSLLLKHALRNQGQEEKGPSEPSDRIAIDRCLEAASQTITSVHDFWIAAEHNNMTAWYSLYYIFQASLALSLMLRTEPDAPFATMWREQIKRVLTITRSMWTINTLSRKCHRIIVHLCRDLLSVDDVHAIVNQADNPISPTDRSSEDQLESFYSMLWPHIDQSNIDTSMPHEDWDTFVNDFSADSNLDTTL